jgi:hypothetical protein
MTLDMPRPNAKAPAMSAALHEQQPEQAFTIIQPLARVAALDCADGLV